MIDICVDEATNLCMQFNSKKCSVIRFGPRYHSQCADVTMLGNSIKLVNSVKLLGVQLYAYKKFRIDIGYMKSKFYRAFNGLFHNAVKLKDELTTMHLVSSYCKPCLLYGTEVVALSATHRRSLSHTWQYVVSKVFHITGDNVSFVCNVTEAVPLCELLIHRNVTFLKNLQKFHGQHLVIAYHSGKNELHELSDIL